LRAVAGEDQLFLLESAGTLPSERATALLGRCLLAGERVAKALTVGDREAALLQLRRLTFGDSIECSLLCPASGCAKRMELVLRIGELLVPAYDVSAYAYDESFVFQGRACEATFRLPTAADLNAIATISREDPERGALELFARCVSRLVVNGVQLAGAEVPHALRSDVAAAMAARDPQAELELDLCCPECGQSFSTVFDTASFFLQELDVRAKSLLQEVHTLAWHYHWSEREILSMPVARRARYLELVSDAIARSRSQ
jgi:hypothetical protein